MSLKKVFTELTWNAVKHTAFGSTVAICVSTTCHYGVELHDQLTSKAAQTYEATKASLATSWGYELKRAPYIEPPKKTILELVDLYASAEGISADLVLATLHQESDGDPLAVSKAGARGIMQIMPETARRTCGITNPDDLKDPETNIRCGVKVLKSALVQTNWNIQAALQVYNLGRTCTIGENCPTETINHGRLIMSRLGKSRDKWNKVKG